MEDKIKERAKITVYFETDEEPFTDCVIKYKDGSILKLNGNKDYETAKYLLKYLLNKDLTEGNIEKGGIPVYLPDIYGDEDEDIISVNDISTLFPDLHEYKKGGD